jgi:hypothetical protein
VKARLQGARFQPTQEVDDLRSIVVYDDFGEPILLMQKVEKGQILVYRAGQNDFEKALKTLGIGLNARCEELSA